MSGDKVAGDKVSGHPLEKLLQRKEKLRREISLWRFFISKCMYFINRKRVILPCESLTTLGESYYLKRVKLKKQVMFDPKRVKQP